MRALWPLASAFAACMAAWRTAAGWLVRFPPAAFLSDSAKTLAAGLSLSSTISVTTCCRCSGAMSPATTTGVAGGVSADPDTGCNAWVAPLAANVPSAISAPAKVLRIEDASVLRPRADGVLNVIAGLPSEWMARLDPRRDREAPARLARDFWYLVVHCSK